MKTIHISKTVSLDMNDMKELLENYADTDKFDPGKIESIEGNSRKITITYGGKTEFTGKEFKDMLRGFMRDSEDSVDFSCRFENDDFTWELDKSDQGVLLITVEAEGDEIESWDSK